MIARTLTILLLLAGAAVADPEKKPAAYPTGKSIQTFAGLKFHLEVPEDLEPGREVIVARCGHEANVGPWTGLESHGARIRWWRIDPESYTCPLEDLGKRPTSLDLEIVSSG